MKQEEKNKRSRELIEIAAIHAFAQQGFAHANLNQMCRENNISKGKLYHYYSSKDDLIVACARRIADRLERDARAYTVDRQLDIAANMHDFYNDRITFWCENPDAFAFLHHCLCCKDEHLHSKLAMESQIFSAGMKDKTLEIIHASDETVCVSDEDVYSTVQVVYDYVLMEYMRRVVELNTAGDKAGAQLQQQALLQHYDRLIQILLHGILA